MKGCRAWSARIGDCEPGIRTAPKMLGDGSSGRMSALIRWSCNVSSQKQTARAPARNGVALQVRSSCGELCAENRDPRLGDEAGVAYVKQVGHRVDGQGMRPVVKGYSIQHTI